MQKETLTATDKLIQAIEARKVQDAEIERLRKEASKEKGHGLIAFALRSDTKKAQTLRTLRETGEDMNAIEICDYNKWSLLSRFYVWTILNYACFEGSPVKRVNLGRYQWVGTQG
jgi:hypothetical protein